MEGSRSDGRLRPPPGRRARPGATFAGPFSSRFPSRITGRETPVALETAEILRRPKDTLSAATTSRLERSSKRSRNAANRCFTRQCLPSFSG